MNPRLERRYRRLLLAYPPQVRAVRAEEILTTLAESGGDRRMPSLREASSLLVEGVRARARLAAADGPGRIWADGLQLGVLLLTFANLGVLLRAAWRYPAWTVLLGATVVAILRARPRVALALTAVAALAAARPLLPMRLPQGLFDWRAPAYGDWSTVARHLAPVLLLALLSLPVLRRQLRARAWWWLGVPVAQVAVPVLVVVVAQAAGSVGLASIGPAQLERLGELGWTAARSAPEAGVAAALGLALVARDPRPAIAAMVLVAPGLAWALEQRAWLSPLASWYWLVIAVTVPLLVLAVVSTDRRQRAER